MHHPRHSIRGLAAACALLPVLALAAPAAADTRPLDLGNPGTQFTSFTCLNDSCSLGQATLAGNATSNSSPHSYDPFTHPVPRAQRAPHRAPRSAQAPPHRAPHPPGQAPESSTTAATARREPGRRSSASPRPAGLTGATRASAPPALSASACSHSAWYSSSRSAARAAPSSRQRSQTDR